MRVYDLLKRGLIAGTLVAGQMLNTANADSKPMDLEGKLQLPTVQEACTQLQEAQPQERTNWLEIGIKETEAEELTFEKRVNVKTERKGAEKRWKEILDGDQSYTFRPLIWSIEDEQRVQLKQMEYSAQEGRLVVPGSNDWGKNRPVKGVEEKVDKEHGWFLTGGECIYASPLKESEKEIGMIDDIGFSLIPDWKRLTTFSDFRDKGLLSDFFIGVGKHLGEHFSAYADIGGGYGYINNHHTYGLLTTHFDFARWDMYAELNGEWFPLGKTHPEFKETGVFKRLIEGAKQAKPVLTVTLGYSLQGSNFHAKFKGPFGNKLISIRQDDEYIAKYVTPTIGVVVPVTNNTDLVAKIGYGIMDVHKNETQGPAALLGFEKTF